MKTPAAPPKQEGEVLVYEIEVDEENLTEPIQVPMQAKSTCLVVRLRPRRHVFSV
jgi:6-phosphogluconolactonase (cycloisomerase 2 family)